MKHSQSEKDKMKALSDLGFSSREIAKIVLGSESKKSSVNNILNSGIVNKTTSDVGGVRMKITQGFFSFQTYIFRITTLIHLLSCST